jgi:hypothetical protein
MRTLRLMRLSKTLRSQSQSKSTMKMTTFLMKALIAEASDVRRNTQRLTRLTILRNRSHGYEQQQQVGQEMMDEKKRVLKKLVMIFKQRSLKLTEKDHSRSFTDPETGQIDKKAPLLSDPEHYEIAAAAIIKMAEDFHRQFSEKGKTHNVEDWITILTREEL